MNRRDFLKAGGLFSLTLFALPGHIARLPVETRSRNLLYRGTFDGKIYTSQDTGQHWQLQTCLGDDYSILELFTDRSEQVHARVGFAGHSFNLVLAPGDKRWRTQS